MNENSELKTKTEALFDSLVKKELKSTGVVYAAMSKQELKLEVLNQDGMFIVTFVSVEGELQANYSIGSVFAIWKRKTD
jgi:fructose-1,6-bisphosphatase